MTVAIPEPSTVEDDGTSLTPDLVEGLQKIKACAHCGGMHVISCPRVKELQYYPDGRINRVRFWKTWDTSRVIFPDDVTDDNT